VKNKNKHKLNYGNHEKLIAWQMADKLDEIVQEILKSVPKNEFEIRRQLDGASDSVGSNIVEGYYSGSISEFIRFLRYARRSCGEVQERVMRLRRKSLLDENLYEKFKPHCIKTGYIIDRLISSLCDKRDNKDKEM